MAKNYSIAMRVVLLLSITACLFVFSVSAQELPKKIRGYKVLGEVASLDSSGPSVQGRASIVVRTPEIADVSLTGITFAVAGELESAGHSGRVHLMTFRDFRLNGLPVEVADYTTSFDVNRKGTTRLPEPATAFIPTQNVLRAAWNEITDSQPEWLVTGRIFVFGRFKKYGLSFKRVVPVDVRLVITNPLAGR